MKRFGEKLVMLREKHGLSQRQLAKLVDIDSRHVGRMEHGQTVPTGTVILKLAEFFGVTPNHLMLDEMELE